MDKREFWTKKPIIPEYDAIVFSHSSFDAPIYLVANQFQPVTLGGVAHTPVPMEVRPPNQSKDENPAITVAFPRIVVGAEFKRQIKKIDKYEPIVMTYRHYLGDNLTTPVVQHVMYVDQQGGVTMNGESVTVKATTNNPMRKAVCRIYEPAVFTGLKAL